MIIFLFFLSFYLGNVLTKALILFIGLAIVFLLCILKRFRLFTFLLCLGGIALGVCFSCISFTPNKNTSSYSGFIYTAKENYFLFNSGGERLYVYSKGHHYDLGDYLTIEGQKEQLDFTVLESSFDFKEYLNNRGVYHSLKVKKIEVKFHNFIRVNEARNHVLSHFNNEEKSIVGAILFSDGGESATSESINGLHLARFLSASGLYVGLFAIGLNYILSLFTKDKYGELITIALLALYMVFTIPKLSVVRVVLILLAKWINTYLFKKKFSYLEVVSLVGISCLVFDHYLAYQDSFILGFSIPLISYLIKDIYPSSKVKSYLFKALTIYLFFIPFEVHYYYKIVILSFPLQIISTPLFLLIGITSLLCFFKIPIFAVYKFFIFLLKGYIAFIKYLSFGVLLPDLPSVLLLVYYLVYLISLYYLSAGFRPLERVFSFTLVAICLLYAIPINNRLTDEVDFINVGQGDCTLIRHHQKVILIDTGGLSYSDIANSSLIPYLRKKRIYKIDSVFITHYDYDHYGALENLKKEYRINHLYDYYSSYPVSVGHLIFNNYNIYGVNNKEENDRSLVLSFRFLNKDFLIMGDAPSWVEKEIIKDKDQLPCDILKLGHHGSDTSTCEEFLTFISPEEAIVSCGKNNKYGHPSPSVVSLLNKHHVKIRRTDIEGTISYKQLSF